MRLGDWPYLAHRPHGIGGKSLAKQGDEAALKEAAHQALMTVTTSRYPLWQEFLSF